MVLLLILLLVVLMVGVMPTWPYSRRWGNYPSGALSLALIAVFVLGLLGEI